MAALRTTVLVLLFATPWLTVAQSPTANAARLMPGFGDVHHPVSTSNPEAQKFFNQGLALSYGFNHEEAERSFRRAAELDPKLAMAWWGVAYVVGPNYNMPVDPEHEKTAYDAIQKAVTLSANTPQIERDYIQALAKRYTNQANPDYHKLAVDYSNAMRDLSHKYPDDLDAATIFAESAMNLRPWQLWNKDGSPAPGTEEIVSTLESVLRRDPTHLGANHFYIHAVEASSHPERALPSAERLAALAPASGHLVHMPGHIYIRTGDHAASEETNVKAAAADEAYIKATGVQGVYPMMYYSHNLHFIAIENANLGNYAASLAAAHKLADHVTPHIDEMPMLDFFASMTPMIMVRFRQWDQILQQPAADPKHVVSAGIWHYARGLAYASKSQVKEAQAEIAELNKLAPEMGKIPTNSVSNANAEAIPVIAVHIVEARIALAQKKNADAIAHLKQAVDLEDAMDYNEPPDWIAPVRETLGGMLLQAGNPVAAEKVFRADLERHPRNPRSLFGLMESLKAQDRTVDAQWVERQFEAAWTNSDTKLRIEDL